MPIDMKRYPPDYKKIGRKPAALAVGVSRKKLERQPALFDLT